MIYSFVCLYGCFVSHVFKDKNHIRQPSCFIIIITILFMLIGTSVFLIGMANMYYLYDLNG
jgi:hypothetical protein